MLDSQRVPVNSDERAKRQGAIPYYGATGQVGWIDSFLFNEELLLIGEDGAPFFDKSKPIAYIVEGMSWVNNHAHVLRAKSGLCSNHYLKYFLDWVDFHEYVNGTTRLKLTQGAMNRIPVRLAPLAEQRRIVAKMDAVLSKVEACQKRLELIPVILKRFRQSVLAAACSGRLTADWREEHHDIESAQRLAERINESRRKHVEARLVAIVPEEDWPDDPIPETWVWANFGSIISELRNGVSLRPRIDPPGVPILRISSTRPGAVDLEDVRYMPDGESFLPQFLLRDGDLLFTRYNGSIELLGICGMVRDVGEKMLLYPDKLMRVRFDHQFVLPAYTEVFFQAARVHERVVVKSKSSAGQNGVSGSDIKGQPFALPPLSEQQEIVRRVEALFKIADRIEVRYQEAKKQVEGLTQSILAKAFRGELVLQDPRDEPASELLARVAAQKSVDARNGRNGKRRVVAGEL